MENSPAVDTTPQVPYVREAGTALMATSLVLGAFLFFPLTPTASPATATVVDATPTDPYAQVLVEAQAAIVYDLATGETLYAKNADAQLPLASLTKLLTVYTAFTQLPANALVTISEAAVSVEEAHTFRAGQELALADLARLTLTASLNDGAAAIAEATAKRESRPESEALTAAAASLSLSQTYALNGSGLDIEDAIPGGYGSARDLARLSGALVEQAPRVAAATTESAARAVSKGGTVFTVKNTNPIVESIPRLLLSKTGYTDLAGGNLALVIDVGIDHPVAVVVLGSTVDARFTDSQALVAATFAHFAGTHTP